MFRLTNHRNVSKPYYELRCDANAPYLPTCYFVMFIATLFPPVWCWVMDKRNANDPRDRPIESLAQH